MASMHCAPALLHSLFTHCAPQACITIQKHARGHAVRHHVARQATAATCIQCHWKRHQAVAAYKCLCSANLCLQAWVRRWAARQQYKRTRAAVITLQVCCLVLTSCALLGVALVGRASNVATSALTAGYVWQVHQGSAGVVRRR